MFVIQTARFARKRHVYTCLHQYISGTKKVRRIGTLDSESVNTQRILAMHSSGILRIFKVFS